MVKIVYAFFYAISLLPFRLLYCIADFEYFMMYYVIKYRRGIVRKNLTTSFPEKSEEEIVDIEKKFYRWFSDYFFEAVKLLSISDKEPRPAAYLCHPCAGARHGLQNVVSHPRSLLQLGVALMCRHQTA